MGARVEVGVLHLEWAKEHRECTTSKWPTHPQLPHILAWQALVPLGFKQASKQASCHQTLQELAVQNLVGCLSWVCAISVINASYRTRSKGLGNVKLSNMSKRRGNL